MISLSALESSTKAAPCCYCWKFKMRSPCGDGKHQRESLGGTDPVAQRDLPSPRQSHLRRAGGRRQQFFLWPTPRSLLDQRGGEHLCSPTVSTHVYLRRTPPCGSVPSGSLSSSPSAPSACAPRHAPPRHR